ncbi:uncharacterized protein SCHCODRAFT_02523922 [Schizophyllum commune H4-8]|nr:uncharacterized protein SCHCODRAFT_02523922 [Schizophyllum commune H4-8]KAI5899419.1 hypothetical protein SCHCODRAFT_02523922 [Schizophyllum commune H4-8]
MSHRSDLESARTTLERAASVANLATLRANEPLTGIQIAGIKDLTSQLESELAKLHRYDTTTDRIRKKILEQLAIHRCLVSPIRRLPEEIMAHIFSLAVDEPEEPERSLPTAIAVSRVCFNWRRVARDHASLWTTVVVEDELAEFKKYEELYLPLTKELPLEVSCEQAKILWDLWDCIAPYASRLRSIVAVGFLKVMPDLKVLYTENLERLAVYALQAPDFKDLSTLDLVASPRLREITVSLETLESDRQLHVPIARALTTLKIVVENPFPVTHVLPFLRSCADTLQSLTIDIEEPPEGLDDSDPTRADGGDVLVMGALTFIELFGFACALLNHITAPRVDNLKLKAVPTYGSRTLLGFLKRGGAAQSLGQLRVSKPKERNQSAWIPCLQLMDNLWKLDFDELLSHRSFIDLLVHYQGWRLLLPSLECIDVHRVFRKRPDLQHDIDVMRHSRQTWIELL